jgi:hypothetical protein
MSAEQVLHDSHLEIASVRVVYLRPAVNELKFAPAIVHHGRSLGVIRVDVTNAAGALCTSATVTARSAAGPRAGARQRLGPELEDEWNSRSLATTYEMTVWPPSGSTVPGAETHGPTA